MTIAPSAPEAADGIARWLEETTANRVAINYGTLYRALLKLEQEGSIVLLIQRRARLAAHLLRWPRRLAIEWIGLDR